MHFAANSYRTAMRLKTHLTVWSLVFVALCTATGSSAQAAGCAHRTENTYVGLDPFGNPLPDNVLKVYSGGDFHYYVLPEGKPCNGPNCKGAPPVNMASVPPVLTSERCDLTFLTNNASAGTLHFCNRFVATAIMRPISPVLEGLLRPPTV